MLKEVLFVGLNDLASGFVILKGVIIKLICRNE